MKPLRNAGISVACRKVDEFIHVCYKVVKINRTYSRRYYRKTLDDNALKKTCPPIVESICPDQVKSRRTE
jgi:hypothetical protein